MMRSEFPETKDQETTGQSCDDRDDGGRLVVIDDLPGMLAIGAAELAVIETFMADILDAVFAADGHGLLAPSASAMSDDSKAAR